MPGCCQRGLDCRGGLAMQCGRVEHCCDPGAVRPVHAVGPVDGRRFAVGAPRAAAGALTGPAVDGEPVGDIPAGRGVAAPRPRHRVARLLGLLEQPFGGDPGLAHGVVAGHDRFTRRPYISVSWTSLLALSRSMASAIASKYSTSVNTPLAMSSVARPPCSTFIVSIPT